MPSFLAGLFVALIEKVCIADYQLRWQDFVAAQLTHLEEHDDDDDDDICAT